MRRTLHVGHFSVITSKMAKRSMRKRGMPDTTSAMSEMYRARSRGGMYRNSDNELKLHEQCSAGQETAHRLSRRRNTAGKTFSARYFNARFEEGRFNEGAWFTIEPHGQNENAPRRDHCGR